MKLRIGIVGTNFISTELCDAAAALPEFEMYAVYSRNQDTGDAFAAKHGIKHIFTDYDQFLCSNLDAVYIASPNFMHCEQTLKALKQNKHVLCEKILATSEPEIRSMIAQAQENNLILLEAMRPDFDPAFHIIENTLPELGRLRRVSFEFCQYSSRYDNFKKGIVQNAFNPRIGNSALMDIGVYCIHTLVRLFGMPGQVTALSTRLENDFDASGIILMEYDGMIAEAIYSKITSSVNPSVIQGEDGSICIDYISRPQKLELCLRNRGEAASGISTKETLPFVPAQNNMIYELKEFAKLISQGKSDHKYLSYSLNTMKVIEQIKNQVSPEH